VIEVGRKIRAPADEEPGVDTYSSVWGCSKAVLIWLSAMTDDICADDCAEDPVLLAGGSAV
jgi:4-hydroxybenzoate polyprenyltransferase